MLAMPHGTLTSSKPMRSCRMTVFLSLIDATWAFLNKPTPSSIIENFANGNVWFDSAGPQATHSLYPALSTESDLYTGHDVDHTQESRHWPTDTIGSQGPSTNRLIGSPSEDQLKAQISPESWPTFQHDVIFSGVHGDGIPWDKGTILSHHSLNHSPSQDSFGTHQYNICHTAGFTNHQDMMFGQQSQSEMRATHQGSHLDQIRNYGASLSNIEFNDESHSSEWDRLQVQLSPDDPFSNFPFHSDENASLGWATRDLATPTPVHHDLQFTHDHSQNQLKGSSDEGICTFHTHMGTGAMEGSQLYTLEAIGTTHNVADQSEPMIHQKQTLIGKKRLSNGIDHEAVPQQGTTSSVCTSKKDHVVWEKNGPSRNKMSKNFKKKQSEVMTDCYSEDNFGSNSSTQEPVISKELEDNYEPSKRTGALRTVPTHIAFPESKKPRIRSFTSLEMNTIILLKDIGEFCVDNSPNLSYKTSIWFANLREDILRSSSQEESLIQHIYTAIYWAHRWLTMSFLGLVSVYENPRDDKLSLEVCLEEGWAFMQGIFEEWRSMGSKFTEFHQDSKNFSGDWIEPLFLFHHFGSISTTMEPSENVLRFIILKWNQHRISSKIPVTQFAKIDETIKNHHNTQLMYISGGLYSREEIGNLEIEALNHQTNIDKKHCKSNPTIKNRVIKCHFISRCAQFHSPTGFELCQAVHEFFTSLIQSLLNKYTEKHSFNLNYSKPKGQQTLTDIKKMDKHYSNIRHIIRGVSIAEYRVTVGFIGMVRALYKDKLSKENLTNLIASAWDYLKSVFSEWENLEYETGRVITPPRTSLETKEFWSDPKSAFHGCCKFLNRWVAPIPVIFLTELLKSWSQRLLAQDSSHEVGLHIQGKAAQYHSCLLWLGNVSQ